MGLRDRLKECDVQITDPALRRIVKIDSLATAMIYGGFGLALGMAVMVPFTAALVDLEVLKALGAEDDPAMASEYEAARDRLAAAIYPALALIIGAFVATPTALVLASVAIRRHNLRRQV